MLFRQETGASRDPLEENPLESPFMPHVTK